MKQKRLLSMISVLFFILILCTLTVNAADVSAPVNKLVVQDNQTYYYNKKGQPVKNQFVTIKKNQYFFDSNGYMVKNNLFTYKQKTYFAKSSGIIAKNTFVNFNEKRYFFNADGIRKTGWIEWKNHKYYCPASGAIYQNSWQKIGKYTYYFNSSYYIVKNKWVGDYYVDKSGHRVGSAVTSSKNKKVTKKVIKMKNIMQNPQLPTGCESVALTMVLKHYGFSLSKTTIASSYLPKSNTNFVTAFWGNPFSSSGGGIYSPGLTTTANKYLSAKKSKLNAYDITGSKFSDLYRYIDNGTPVIVWNSMYMRNPVPVYSYQQGGKSWTFFRSEHCVVLCGYDKKKNKVLINDSLSGLVWRNASSFTNIYNKMGKMAVVIR